MDLRHLHHFDMLAETGSLHRAACRLGLRQPALSQSIRALETDVGTRLVERSPTGSRLTRAGTAFLHEVRAILAALDRAVHIARLAANTPAPLRLSVTADIATRRLTALVQKFREINPEDRVIVSDGSATHLLSQLDAELLDLVLLPAAVMIGYGGNRETLWREDLHLALPTAHPLAAEAVIDLRRLAEEPVIVGAGREPWAADKVLLEGCRTTGVVPQVVAAVQHQEVRLALVAAGVGLTTLPASRLETETGNGIVHRPTMPPLHLSVAAAWPASGPSAPARRFLDQARALVTDGNHPSAGPREAPEEEARQPPR